MDQQKKHILILSSWYPNQNQPFLGNFVKTQAELLSEIYKVSVLYIQSAENCKSIEFEIKEADSFSEIIAYYPKKSNPFSSYRMAIQALKRGLSKINNIDLIHGHVMLPKGYLFLKAKAILNKPLIVTEHSSVFLQNAKSQMGLKNRLLISRLGKKADQIIAVSHVLKATMKSLFPSTQEIEVIGNPVKTQLFKLKPTIQSNFTTFLHVSTLDMVNKNPEGIISAVELLVKNGHENFRLRIVSDEDFSLLENMVKNKDLSHFIQFYGPCKPEELVQHYHESDAFVLFSNFETFSIVLAEAWSCGLPVISTPVGIANNLNCDLGIQVGRNDIDALARAMLTIMEGKKFDSKSIRNHALQYAEQQILMQIQTIYNKYLG